MKNTANPINDQAIDLMYTGWKWLHSDQHSIVQNLNMPIGDTQRNNDELDARGPFLVQADKPLIFSAPITNALDPTYSPSKENPTLFKLFTDMDSTPENFINFANKFGLLKHAGILFSEKDKYAFGESVQFWYREQWMLKYAIYLWEWIKNNDKEKLSLVIQWKDEWHIDFQLASPQIMKDFISNDFKWTGYAYSLLIGSLECCGNTDYHLTAKIYSIHEIRQQTKVGDILLPAIRLLQSIINYYLSTYPVKPTLFYNVKTMQYHQQLTPLNLLSAMWYQFQQVITGERQIKQCPICRQWSDVTNIKGSWEKHRDCANWDRVTKRRKINSILDLVEQGLTVHDISAKVNINSCDIERWLNEEQQKLKKGNYAE